MSKGVLFKWSGAAVKKIVRITIAVLSLYILLNGCSVQELEPPSSLSAATTVLASSGDAAEAFSSVLQARDFVITTSNLFRDLGEVTFNIMSTDPTLSTSGTGTTPISCSDGGSYTYTGTVTGTTYDLSVTFNGCRQNRFQYQGTYTVTGGTPGDITVNLAGGGSTFNIFYFNDDYTVLIDYLQASSSFTLSGSGNSTAASYTITPSGSISIFDYFLLNSFSLTFSQTSMSYLLDTNTSTGAQTLYLSTNGSVRETSSFGGVTFLLTGFSVDRTKSSSGGGSFTGDDTSMSGTATFSHSPSGSCAKGVFVITTQTPIHRDYLSGKTTQGLLTLNDVASAQYNTGGDIDVSLTGSSALNYADELALMKACDYAALEENTSDLLGPTGSAVGSTMAITLTWYGPSGSTSDMDLHLKYYNILDPASSPTTTETWHMDWHQGSSCSNPAGLSFSDALDLNGDGICDVGLDFDDTNGYGPEHITALSLPAGYYVVSVNSYSLNVDPSATMYLAVHIGDYIFGPYSTTLSSSDGEGTNPAAWFRVADVRVNGDGTVDVLSPNSSLTPWH